MILNLTCRLEWKPEDLWVGAFWRREWDRVDLWVCLLPCVPLHFKWTLGRRCQEPGCREAGMACGALDPFAEDGEPEAFYCGEHSAEHDYCRGCGMVQGLEWDRPAGYCYGCSKEMRRDEERDMEPDWDFSEEEVWA